MKVRKTVLAGCQAEISIIFSFFVYTLPVQLRNMQLCTMLHLGYIHINVYSVDFLDFGTNQIAASQLGIYSHVMMTQCL